MNGVNKEKEKENQNDIKTEEDDVRMIEVLIYRTPVPFVFTTFCNFCKNVWKYLVSNTSKKKNKAISPCAKIS
jgi:hypothetical protein